MTKSLVRLLALLFATLATPAFGQATRTWVSGVGDDVNPCSRTAPCKTFAGAISKTAAGGEISVLDSGGFGGVTITKSITIDGAGANGSILAVGQNGITVNGANIVVNLRNLNINGAGSTIGNGIRILNAAAVNVDNVNIMNLAGTGTNGRGITVETAIANFRLTVRNSSFFNLGSHGIHSNPTAGSVFMTVDHVSMARGGNAGIQLRQLTTATIDNSSITTHGNGAAVGLELTTAVATISNSLLASNAFGVANAAAGGAPTAFLYGNVITRNTTAGLNILSGSMTSLGNNLIRGNAGNETPTTTIGTQ
jgi:hypothetical protein